VSFAKRNKVKCRVCLTEVLLQNYRVHIQRQHPEEKPNDLRPACQSSIVSLFNRVDGPVGRKRARNDEENNEAKRAFEETIEPTCTDDLGESSDDLRDPHGEFTELAMTVVAPEVSEDQKTSDLESNLESEATVAIDAKQTPYLLSQINEKLDNLSLKLDEMRGNSNLTLDHSGDDSAALYTSSPRETVLPDNFLMNSCRSLDDLLRKFDEFRYDERKQAVLCSVCVPVTQHLPELTTNKTYLAIFKYDKIVGAIDPPEKVLSKKFRNLKTHLLAHLKSTSHITALERRTVNEKELDKSDRRERVVGKRIGRICYYMFKQGRPDSDFEHLVYLHSVNDSDIGDINHSNKFPAKILPIMSNEVTQRLTRFLDNPLEQTGFRPSGKIGADKATWKHRTRQFVTFTTIVPDSPKLLHTFFLATLLLNSTLELV
jgi:hypothetical protein